MFHGCGGAYDRNGKLARRMHEYAELFNGLGMHVLVVDSLTARYEKELCTQRAGTRRVTQANRRLDALGAIAYLADRADVDAKRIGLIGWSNGGSTVVWRRPTCATATSSRRPSSRRSRSPSIRAARATCGAATRRRRRCSCWSPSSTTGLRRRRAPRSPRRADEPRPEIVVYPGAWHGFDSDAPVRVRKDVPNGTTPGQGVHVGGNPAAWRASRDRVVRFLAEH